MSDLFKDSVDYSIKEWVVPTFSGMLFPPPKWKTIDIVFSHKLLLTCLVFHLHIC